MLEVLGLSSNQFSVQHTGCRTSPTSSLHGVLVQGACVAPAHPEPLSLRGLGSSPPVDKARDTGSLIQPVLCTTYWLSHVSDQSPTRSTGLGCLRGTCPS